MAEGEVAAALGVKSSDGTTGNGGLDGGGGGWLQAMSSGARCSEVMGVRDLDAGCREARGRGSSHHGDREELGSPRALQAAGGGDARARWLLVAVEEAEDGAGTIGGRETRGPIGSTGQRGAEAKQGRGRGDAEELGVHGGIHGGAALRRSGRRHRRCGCC